MAVFGEFVGSRGGILVVNNHLGGMGREKKGRRTFPSEKV